MASWRRLSGLLILFRRVASFWLLGASLTQAPSAAGATTLRTVALTRGAPAPGTSLGFELFSSIPVLNNSGQVAFSGLIGDSVIVDPEDYSRYGIWSEGNGSLKLAARGGDVAPGTTQTIQYPYDPAIDAAGRTVFLSRLSGIPATDNWGVAIQRSGPAGLESLAVLGEQAADFTPNHIYNWIGPPQVNDVGQIAFQGGLGTSISHGVNAFWVGEPLDLKMALRTGAEEYGDSEKYTINSLWSSSGLADAAALNNRGELVFEAALSHRGLPPMVFEQSLWRFDENGATPMVRQSEDAPGTGNTFARFGAPTLNDAGQTIFTAQLTNPNDSWRPYEGGLWMIDGDTLQNILPPAAPAPGMPGLTMHMGGNSAVINGQGEVVVLAYLKGEGVGSENQESLWRLKGDSLELIARQGDPIPGGDSQYLGLGSYAINGAGQVAFMSTRREFGNFSDQLLVQNPDGSLIEIASTGSLLEVAPGDLRLLTQISFLGGSGLEDGRRVGFNERGQVAFRAEFADGSMGLFVSSLAAIPEPNGAASLAVGVMGSTTIRQRRRFHR